jgi:CheY-like chemotaxis protein
LAESITLLLVEDDPLVLMDAQHTLETGGYTVVPVSSGDEAIGILDARADELVGVVTDIRLGAGPDGWEVARRARELNSNIPVVYTTGDSADDWPAHGVPNSVIVHKPAQLNLTDANGEERSWSDISCKCATAPRSCWTQKG